MKDNFNQASFIAIQDIQLQTALDRGTTRAVNGRLTAMDETTDAQALRQQGARARERALNRLPELLEQLEANVISNGGHVLWARDAAEANQIVVLLRDRKTRQIVAHRLSAHPEAERLLDALRTREFWLARGEDFADDEGEAAES